jgi:transcriptional regulator with XRE-family HTH domain
MNTARKSHKRDTLSASDPGQAANPVNGIDASGFPERLKAALAGRVAAEVARGAGIPAQTLGGYLKGAIPSADRALALADELGVDYRWLIAGIDAPAAVSDDADNVKIDRYDAFSFSEYGKGERVEEITIPRWLLSSVKQSSGIWLCEMPSDALPSVAREGEMVICRDAELPLQDRRVYIFLIDGRPVVRRVFVRPDGLQLAGETDDAAIIFRAEDAEHVVAIARVLAAISLSQV